MRVPDDLPLLAVSADAARQYTPEQLQAIERRRGPLALSAAAGSGKTSVLVERFVAAVLADGLAPAQILAITFTERAAGELRERVRARFLELGERAAARDSEAAFVSTFHGFCARLLRAHALQAGVDPDFEILDEGTAGRLRMRAFSRALGELVGSGEPDAVDLAAAYGAERLRGMIESVHAALRSRGEASPRLPLPAEGPVLAVRACVQLDRLLAAFDAAYEDSKSERGALDFDDLELRARELLAREDGVRRRLRERFELLMVDEFQDTNLRQLDILNALARENLFTVGDELQSIYGFRHADVGLFRARNAQLAPAGGMLALTHNFRSRPEVLDAIGAIFDERLRGFIAPVAARAEPASAERARSAPAAVELLLLDKGGWGEHPELEREIAAGLPRAAPWRQAEARLVAARLAELVAGTQVRAGEIAVLLRALGDIHVYERALAQAGLRTIAAAGAFWEQQQVEDLIAYLRALANPLDSLALFGALSSPLVHAPTGAASVGVSIDALALLAGAARERGCSAFEAALDGSAAELLALPREERAAIQGFCANLQQERAELSRRSISELLERALVRSDYREQLIAGEQGERAVANLNKLLRLARGFEAREGRDLRAFLDHVAYLKQASRSGESEAPVEGVEPDAVRLMSIHAAKGLEFPVVCVADLGRGPNLRMPDLLVEGERIGLNLASLDGTPAAPVLDYEELCTTRRGEEEREEDRIAYVAMTRARDMLLLSGAVELERWPEGRQSACALGWIGPALHPELPALALAARLQRRTELELEVGQRPTTVRCLLASPDAPELLRPYAGAPALHEQLALPLEHPALAAPRSRDAIEVHGTTDASAAPDAPAEPAGGPAAHDALAELDGALSFSSLSALERCGYRYYLERVLRLPEERESRGASGQRPDGPRHGQLQARERGVLVHRLLEDLDFARPRAPDAERVLEIATVIGLRLGREEATRVARQLQAALAAEPARRAAGAQSVRREYSFAFSLAGGEEPLIGGVIDLLAIEPDGGALVLDYKTNALAPGEDLDALVERDYSLQREIYALAVLLTGAPDVEIVHWFLERPEDHVARRYAARQRGSLETLLQRRLERARSRGYAVSPRPHRGLCEGCPGRSGLCSWPPEETLSETPPDA